MQKQIFPLCLLGHFSLQIPYNLSSCELDILGMNMLVASLHKCSFKKYYMIFKEVVPLYVCYGLEVLNTYGKTHG
jgi:hypothetical protein